MLFVLAVCLLAFCDAHSWIRCSKYVEADGSLGVIRGNDYNPRKCRGWIRGDDYDGGSRRFGQDKGWEMENGDFGRKHGQPICGRMRGDSKSLRPIRGNSGNGYSQNYRRGVVNYRSGEAVRLVYPAKNHANYGCRNMADASLKLYVNRQRNPTFDPDDQGSWRLVKDFQAGCTPKTPGCGFNNCPKFCENTETAVCFNDFTVPNLADGFYTFLWHWALNPGEWYSSCWEAKVGGGGGGGRPQLPPPTNNGGGNNGGGNNGGGGGRPPRGGNHNVRIVNSGGMQKWWLEFYVRGLDRCGNLGLVEIKCRGYGWTGAGYQNGYYYVENQGREFRTPVSVRIGGRELRNVIRNFNPGSSFNAGNMGCPGEALVVDVNDNDLDVDDYDYDYEPVEEWTYKTAFQALVVVNVGVFAVLLARKCLKKDKGYEKVIMVESSDEEHV